MAAIFSDHYLMKAGNKDACSFRKATRNAVGLNRGMRLLFKVGQFEWATFLAFVQDRTEECQPFV